MPYRHYYALQTFQIVSREIELLLVQDSTTLIYELNWKPKRDSNGAVIIVGGHYWAVVPIDSQVGRPSESGGS